MTDSHEEALGRAQARLRTARAEYRRFVAGMDATSNRAVRHLSALKGEVRSAAREVQDAQQALEGASRARRYMMLGV